MFNQLNLKFNDSQMEADFNAGYLLTELKVFRYAALLGFVTYFAFIPLDNLLYDNHTATQFLILRISIAFVSLIAFILSYVLIKTYQQYQLFAITLSIICLGANVSFTFFDGVDDFYFYTGNSILIIFIFILLNIRFFYLMFIAIFYLLVHLFILYLNFDFSIQGFTHQAYGITSVILISLVSNHIIELQKRQDFLNKRLIEEQREILKANILEKDKLLEILKEQNKELDAFNHSVSHDLKTPLRNINSFSKLLEKRNKHQLDDRGLEYLNFIIGGTNKMNNLVDDLLNYSKIRYSEIQKEEVNMDGIVEAAFAEQVEFLDKKPILRKPVLPSVLGDTILLKQVWSNLISNALKYSSKTENIEITVGATQENDCITYFIQDNGIGFDMKFATHLFEIFTRLHTDNEYSGTGVGLSLVDRIIKKHSGKIWAESIPNKGSIFYFTLPKL